VAVGTLLGHEVRSEFVDCTARAFMDSNDFQYEFAR